MLVYIREAHPIDGWVMPENQEAGIQVTDPTTLQERQAVAETACTKLHLDFPAVVDRLDNQVGTAYAGWPDRIYVIRADGKVGFKSEPGPWGFEPDDLAGYLKTTVGPPAAGAAAPAPGLPVAALPQAGHPAPSIDAPGLSGGRVSLAAFKGKVTLVDFWATWCRGCVESMTALKALYTHYHPAGLEIVGVTLDGAPATDQATVRRFVTEKAIPWPQVYDGKAWDSPIAASYGLTALPETILVGPDGNVIGVGLTGADLDKAIAAALPKS
jgi:peroxiredoxin